MKADNAYRASCIVSHAETLASAAERLLSEDAGEAVTVKVMHAGFGRVLAEVRVPPTYIAKALKEYRESLVLEGEALGVEF